MRKLIITLSLILAAVFCYAQKAQIKNVRYFYIGYNAQNEEQSINGGVTYKSYVFPNLLAIKKEIYNLIKGKFETPIKLENCVVISIYEFKNYYEYYKFSENKK
jgi:hypothetical protein